MAYPTTPVRQYSFTDHSTNTPTVPQPGDRLDSEIDRSNQSISQVISYLGVSLNTDGTLKSGSVGQSQLAAGLFDFISQDAIADVQPLVDQAQGFASSAQTSATTANTAKNDAQTSATLATGSASAAQTSQTAAAMLAGDALARANAAQVSASDAANSDNHALGAANLADDLAVLAEAWAEYMPDTIPPNILAVKDITGDHWSARWWAHKAAGAFGNLSELYLGVWPVPPLTTALGEPIPVGALYYNSTTQQPYVWDGAQWMAFWAPAKAHTTTLAYQLAAGATTIDLKVNDIRGGNYTINPADPEPLDVYLNGVRVIQTLDWSLNLNTSVITLTVPARAGETAMIDVLSPVSALAPSRVVTKILLDFDIDPATGTPGQIDGTRKTFSLALASDSTTVVVASPVELQVSLDGVIQKPGTDYSTITSQITFSDAPIPGASAWGIWFGS